MNKHPLSTVRLSAIAFVLLALFVVAGCGSIDGPSENKVRLDLLDRINAAYRGMLVTDDFTVTDRQVLSEDRIKFLVIVSYQLDPQKERQQERSNKVFGDDGFLRKARRDAGHDEKATVVYKRTGQGVWQMHNIQAGYQ